MKISISEKEHKTTLIIEVDNTEDDIDDLLWFDDFLEELKSYINDNRIIVDLD